MSRFLVPTKKMVGINEELQIVILSSTKNYKMKTRRAKFDIDTIHGPLVFRQSLALKKKFPNSQIHLCVGANYISANNLVRNELKDFHIKLIENQLWQETSEVESLRLAYNTIIGRKDFLIVSGDVLFDPQALGFVEPNKSSTSYYASENELEIGLNFNKSMDNKLNGLGFDLNFRWSNLLYLTGDELDIFSRFMVPKNRTLELWQLLDYIIKARGSIFCRENKGFLLRALCPESLTRISQL